MLLLKLSEDLVPNSNERIIYVYMSLNEFAWTEIRSWGSRSFNFEEEPLQRPDQAGDAYPQGTVPVTERRHQSPCSRGKDHLLSITVPGLSRKWKCS